jgi:high affinity Mn2+ porin
MIYIFALAVFCSSLFSARAQTPTISKDTSILYEQWSAHYQFTSILQEHPAINAPYSGRNSLSAGKQTEMTITSTLFLGARLWQGAELYINPEIAGGSGISGSTGLAGFPNGEAVRAGNPKPVLYPARVYLRQIIGLSDQKERITEDANQLAGEYAAHRLEFQIGKFSMLDIFDDNEYSHDARTQFLNWSIMAPGAWDFGADVRGYIWGAALSYKSPEWGINTAFTMVPNEANGADMDTKLSDAHTINVELWHRFHLIKNRPGTLHLIGFMNNAQMGAYQKALELSPIAPDITQQRGTYRSKYGFALTAEQPINEDLGVFARYSWNDGKNETWMFTQIDNSYVIGSEIKGELWGRKTDHAGLAIASNGISADHQRYLAAGGYGFIVGDGALNYSRENIIEAYYSMRFARSLSIALNYQYIWNPAYNQDRGPVSLYAIRFHADFGEPD